MKKYIIFTGIFVMGGLLAGCGATQGKDIGKDSAKNIAFEEAGVTEDQVSRLRVSKDRDDGRVVYEIDFDAGETEYNYDIAAKNGEILSAETEKRDSFANVQPNAEPAPQTQKESGSQEQQNTADSQTDTALSQATENTQPQTPVQGNSHNIQTAISQEEAQKAALARVPGAELKDLYMELEIDDGQYIYEGDIVYQQTEYEFEIDANTGDFLKWSEETY